MAKRPEPRTMTPEETLDACKRFARSIAMKLLPMTVDRFNGPDDITALQNRLLALSESSRPVARRLRLMWAR